jgi:hypothetical protein
VVGVEQRSERTTASITFGNVGDMVMPVVYRVTFDDGDDGGSAVAGGDLVLDAGVDNGDPGGGARVVSVSLDPEGRMPDVNAANDRWQAPAPEEPSAATSH